MQIFPQFGWSLIKVNKMSCALRNSVVQTLKYRRLFSSDIAPKNSISSTFENRNPRNLERMRIGYKPDGYHLEVAGKCYWHKLDLQVTNQYVTARILHFENGEVLKASTSEWVIKKHLYKTTDFAAFVNLGRILAERCLKCGLTEISNFITPPTPNGKIAAFIKALEDGGVSLTEPPQYKPSYPWDQHRPEKPWEVTE